MTMIKDLNMEWILDYMPPTSPADAAVAIIKGGAQRWQRIHFPYLETRPMEILSNIIPQSIANINRRMFEDNV